MSFVSDLFKKCGQKLILITAIAYAGLEFLSNIVYAVEGSSALATWIGMLLMFAMIALVVWGKQKGNAQYAMIGLLLLTGYYVINCFTGIFNLLENIGNQFDYSAWFGLQVLMLIFADIAFTALGAAYLAKLFNVKFPAIVGDLSVLVGVCAVVLSLIFYVIGAIVKDYSFGYVLAAVFGDFAVAALFVLYAAATGEDSAN